MYWSNSLHLRWFQTELQNLQCFPCCLVFFRKQFSQLSSSLIFLLQLFKLTLLPETILFGFWYVLLNVLFGNRKQAKSQKTFNQIAFYGCENTTAIALFNFSLCAVFDFKKITKARELPKNSKDSEEFLPLKLRAEEDERPLRCQSQHISLLACHDSASAVCLVHLHGAQQQLTPSELLCYLLWQISMITDQQLQWPKNKSFISGLLSTPEKGVMNE